MTFKINKISKSNRVFLLAVGAVVLAGSGLYIGQDAIAAAPSAAEQPAMPVNAVIAKETTAPVWSEYSGTLDAVDYVELRPQVSGTIKEIRFEDGQNVKQGEILYVIDPAPYEAAAAQAQADLAGSQSQYTFAKKELERAQDLAKTGAMSQTLLDERQNNASVAKNNIAAAAARLKQAKIDVDYAYVKAPISGRVGRAEITEGNLVQTGPNAPILTTIAANDAIYADFDVDETTYLQQVRNNTSGVEGEREIPVKLTVRGDEKNVYDGTIHSFDNRINAETGTIRARALFKNDDGALLPGMFATIKMGSSGTEKKILIPERAVGTDQDRRFVFVVGPDNKIIYREVKLGASIDGLRVVLDGVKGGEIVVVEGLARLRPDMVVAPQVQKETAAVAPVQRAAEQKSSDEGPADELLKKVETK